MLCFAFAGPGCDYSDVDFEGEIFILFEGTTVQEC